MTFKIFCICSSKTRIFNKLENKMDDFIHNHEYLKLLVVFQNLVSLKYNYEAK